MTQLDLTRPTAAMLRCALLAVLALVGTALAASSQAAPPPASAFGRSPALDHLAVSPNGLWLAWSQAIEGGQLVVMHDAGTLKSQPAIRITDGAKLRRLDWSDDNTLLITVSTAYLDKDGDRPQMYEFLRTQALDVDGKSARTLLMDDGNRGLVTSGRIVSLQTAKPDTIIMSSLDWSRVNASRDTGSRIDRGRAGSGWIDNLYSVDTNTGKGKRIAAGTSFTSEWLVDAAGEPVARSEWDPSRSLFQLLARSGSTWKTVYEQSDGEAPALVGLSDDGSAALVVAARSQSRVRLWALPLDGAAPRIVAEDAQHDVIGVEQDPHSRRVVGVHLGGPDSRIRWLDPTAESRYRKLSRTFAPRNAEIIGQSADATRLLAAVSNPSSPVVYYLVDFRSNRAQIIGDAYPELNGQALGTVQAIEYKARDGYTVPAYLTLPPGAAPKSLPMIVLPHGGPESRDYLQFDWWAQFLATRGYAVLQPQFRGSTGFGEAHRIAGVRQWGKLMQDDLTDAVQDAIDKGLADPKRICIVGASYGGYAALAGAVFTPELYACAASVNGVSDLPLMLRKVDLQGGDDSDSLLHWRSHIGDVMDPDVIGKSPARRAFDVKAPVLLMHGENDSVVPIGQSELMARRLADAQRPHRLVRLEGEDHWLTQAATRVRMLRELEAFLAGQLLPATAPPP